MLATVAGESEDRQMKCPYCDSPLTPEARFEEVDGETMIEVELACSATEDPNCTYENWTYLKPRIVNCN